MKEKQLEKGEKVAVCIMYMYMYMYIYMHRGIDVVHVHVPFSTVTPGKRSMNPAWREGGHCWTRHSTRPCSFSLTV